MMTLLLFLCNLLITSQSAEIATDITQRIKFISYSSYPIISTSDPATDSNNDGLFVPSMLPLNGTMSPIIGFDDDKIRIIDILANTTYSVSTQSSNSFSDLNEQIPVQLSDVADTIKYGAACITSKCYTKVDADIYIIYDDTPEILVYNLQNNQFEDAITFQYPGKYCLTNNGSHVYAVGEEANILIFDIQENEISWSDDYVSNGEVLTCSMDMNKENMYIFMSYGIFIYNVSEDKVYTKFDREYEFPYNITTGSEEIEYLTSTDANSNDGIIWIKDEMNIYGYSTKTDRFLGCSVQQSVGTIWDSLWYGYSDNDDYLLYKMGGIATTDWDVNIMDVNDLNYIDDIKLIDTSFTKQSHFELNDYYYPNIPIAFNYTADIFGTDGYVKVELSSFNFNTSGIHINLGTSTGIVNQCEVCYNNEYDGNCASCIDGLSVALIDDDNMDITDIIYSIEAATVIDSNNNVLNSSDARFLCNSFPIYPVYLAIDVSLYSDDNFYLTFNYEYLCNGCNVSSFNDGDLYPFTSSIIISSEALGIEDNTATIKIVNQKSCIIEINDDKYNCSNYTLSHLSEIFFRGEYIVSLSSSDTYLSSAAILLKLSNATTGCPAGTGYDELTDSCSICADGSFSLRSDLTKCISCTGLDGVSCYGGKRISVDHRYWVSGYRQSTDEYITLFEINNVSNLFGDDYNENDDVLISSICGYGQCCNEVDGCDYVEYFNDNALCSNNRDITSAMCTRCTSGNYELLSTNDCGGCDYYDNMWYLIGTFSIAFILVFYLSFCDAKPLDIMIYKVKHRHDADNSDCDDSSHGDDNDDDDYSDSSDGDDGDGGYKKERRMKKRKPKHYKNQESVAELDFTYFVADSYIANSALIFQIFVYYFQGYAEILSSSGSRAYLSPIINFFNFNFANDQVGSNGDDDTNAGFCAIPFSTALSEICMTLIFPALMLFSLLLIYSFCHRGFGNYSYFTKPYVAISFFRIWIILIGLIFRVLMQLITCTRFVNLDSWRDEKWEQFFFNEPCFGVAWWVALFSFIILFIYFIQIYKKLYQQCDEDRYATNNKYTKLVQSYKNCYWYWEAVITTRRFIITMFVTLSFIGGGYSNLILCLILIFYLIAHLTIYPFKHKRNNRIETFCILSILIGFIGINFEDIANSLFLSLFLGIVIFIPIIIALYYFLKLCINCKAYYEGDEHYFLDSRSKRTADDKMDFLKTRVLNKRPSYKQDNAEPVDIYKTEPITDDGRSINVEMATIKYSTKDTNKNDGHHSDSSCGLTE